jgi:hypothetical protein
MLEECLANCFFGGRRQRKTLFDLGFRAALKENRKSIGHADTFPIQSG